MLYLCTHLHITQQIYIIIMEKAKKITPILTAMPVGSEEVYPLSRSSVVRNTAYRWNLEQGMEAGARLRCVLDRKRGVIRVTKEELLYHVQETLGGWKQEAVFSGSLSDCQDYYEKNHLDMQSGWAIVADTMYEVDCLDEAR